MNVEVSVLLIEPEDDLRQSLREFLERDGYAIAEASDGRDGLFQFHVHEPDLTIIDAGLLIPVSCWQALEHIRSMSPAAGVMMIGLKREEIPDPYADDEYLDAAAKPISRVEVLARARALTRFRKLPGTET
jgi:DNA-binding response OmpR family regulator